MDQSAHSVGVDYISIFHPNNPPLVLSMLLGCVATIPVVSIEAVMFTS